MRTKIGFSKILSGEYLDILCFKFIKQDVLYEFNTLRPEEKKKYEKLKGKQGCDLPIGIKEDIENMQFKDVIDFYSKFYTTRDALVCIVGSISNMERAYVLCEKSLSKLERNTIYTRRDLPQINYKKDYFFKESGNYIEYYIKRKKLPVNLKERCLEDVCFLIIENNFSKIIGAELEMNINCENVIYTYFSYYIKISIQTNNELKLGLFDIRKILKDSLNYGIYDDLTVLIESYAEYLNEYDVVGLEDYTEELLDCFFFNSPFFSLNEYIMELKKITKREVYEMASDLFYL